MSSPADERQLAQERATKELVEAQVAEGLDGIKKHLVRIEGKLDASNRLRNLALITAVVCLIAAGFSAGYALTSREQLDTAKLQLREQIETNRRVVCSTARSTAIAFREPQISADGTKEPQDHFIDRMLAQRETLRLAGPLHCVELPGFATFPFLRGRALYEIAALLHDANPKRFHPPALDHPPSFNNPTTDSGSTAPSEPTGSAPTEGQTGQGGGQTTSNPPASNPPNHTHHGGGGGGTGGGTGGGSGGGGSQESEPVASEPAGEQSSGGGSGGGPITTTPEEEASSGGSSGVNLEVLPEVELPVKPEVCLKPVVGLNCHR